MFKVYSISFTLGVALVTLWNLNHEYHWFDSLSRFYGVGVGLCIFAGAYYVYEDVKKRLQNRYYYTQRIISTFFLYLSFSNLSNEFYGDPYAIDASEYIIALFMLILIITINTYASRKQRLD